MDIDIVTTTGEQSVVTLSRSGDGSSVDVWYCDVRHAHIPVEELRGWLARRGALREPGRWGRVEFTVQQGRTLLTVRPEVVDQPLVLTDLSHLTRS
ncbi:hypothetical protein [Kineosporia sp. NBRC 101731]|uniref:hypothetical protein n=1 Tax=Kineosporia sp. NBRC 101731 TaxID=3032199 RepID=UPI0024A454BF|nr:hypothetical protein [Kineosporia sp. NBRC 101731]GLY29381.1 hypothetical protein Kisp02_27460 [Kineosporia sp. NBRC 101731]